MDGWVEVELPGDVLRHVAFQDGKVVVGEGGDSCVPEEVLLDALALDDVLCRVVDCPESVFDVLFHFSKLEGEAFVDGFPVDASDGAVEEQGGCGHHEEPYQGGAECEFPVKHVHGWVIASLARKRKFSRLFRMIISMGESVASFSVICNICFIVKHCYKK